MYLLTKNCNDFWETPPCPPFVLSPDSNKECFRVSVSIFNAYGLCRLLWWKSPFRKKVDSRLLWQTPLSILLMPTAHPVNEKENKNRSIWDGILSITAKCLSRSSPCSPGAWISLIRFCCRSQDQKWQASSSRWASILSAVCRPWLSCLLQSQLSLCSSLPTLLVAQNFAITAFRLPFSLMSPVGVLVHRSLEIPGTSTHRGIKRPNRVHEM